MTAIAYRDGVLAADSVGWTAGCSVKVPVAPKIRRLPCGVYAAAGNTTVIDEFYDWMSGDPLARRPEGLVDEDFSSICVRPNGTVWFCTHRLHFTQLHAEFLAIGGPSEFMMGALFAGATAEQAVRLAIEHTYSAGGHVQTMRIGQ